MTLMTEYTSACQKTWKLANKGGITHLHLGILGEFGEVCDVIKKYIRGDFKKEQFKSNIKKEIGDLTWYLVTYAHDNSLLSISDEFPKPKNSRILDNIKKMTVLNGRLAIADSHQEKRIIIKNLIGKTTDLAWCFGFTMEDICRKNIEKTHSRANRGVIFGNGNDR